MQQTTMSRQQTRSAVAVAVRDVSVPLRLAFFLFALAVLGALFVPRAMALDSENIRTAKALSNAYAEVVEHVGPAVVGIETEKIRKGGGMSLRGMQDEWDILERFFDLPPGFKRPTPERRAPEDDVSRGIGSGVVIDVDGHILTNNHVVADADNINIEFSTQKGRKYKAEIVGRDPNSDLAVIKLLEQPDELPVAVLGDSDDLKPGNIVIAIGSPLGLRSSVTSGVVSAKDRSLGELAYERFIQTDASINPGNSGGPLVNLDGEVVGLNTMISTAGGRSGSIGIGFAIPINQAKSVVKQLIEKGSVTRGWLGIVMNPEDQDISKDLGHDGSGVLVTEVESSGPAAKAGIRRGDLIVSFDNIAIRDNEHLRYLVAETNPGRDVPVTVVRDNDRVNLTINIQAQPEDLYTNANRRRGGGGGSGNMGDAEEVSSSLGLSVRNLDDATRQKYNISEQVTHGVVVTEIDETGEAKNAGVRPGTVILEMNNLPVQDIASFRKILKDSEGKEKILVFMRYGEVSRYIRLKLM